LSATRISRRSNGRTRWRPPHAAVGFTSRMGTEYNCSPLTLRT
jgi:hypothetical protein